MGTVTGKELAARKEAVENATSNVYYLSKKIRPRTADGTPGGYLDLRGVNKEIYILGDLHGNIHNLKCTLKTDNLQEKLEQDKAVLILLGDLVHNDHTGSLRETKGSIEILDFTIDLINQYPGNILYTLGNHDTFDPRLAKSGIKQGLNFYTHLKAHYDDEYCNLIHALWNCLPLMVEGDRFLAVHAGPVRGGCTREHTIEIRRYETDYWQMIWNRVNQIGSIPNNKEYNQEDIRQTFKLFEKSPDSYFIVGHNPLFERGGSDSIWFDVADIPNYIILYASEEETCPILKFSPGQTEYELLHADLQITKSRFVLGDMY